MKPELEFLPAALEIQETPPLAAGRYILWAIIMFFTISLVWSIVGMVDIVGVAQGKIVPSGRVKIIQPLETGIVRNIFVNEGDNVIEGQVLIELDTTQSSADRRQIQEQQLTLVLDRARLLTILEAIENSSEGLAADNNSIDSFPVSSNSIAKQLIPEDVSPRLLDAVEQRVKSQLNEYYARNQALKDEMRQRQGERSAIFQRIEQLDATVPLITERTDSLKGLLAKDMIPRVQWLELEQERIEQVTERDVQRNNLTSIEAAIANIGQRLSAQNAEYMSQLLTELAEVETRISGFEQEFIKAEQRVSLQMLKAPVGGTVHQLAVHTVGGVVTPAQELMQIVPDSDAIEVEAWIQNKDIGFVQKGQRAEIKVETFPFTRYGIIDAELLTVSNDATPDEQLGLVYAARVKMEKSTINVENKIVNLSPGMAVTVEVNMGKRRLIEYLMSPLLRYKDESVRER